MLNAQVEELLNKQIAHELTNSKKYRVVSSFFNSKGLVGLAKYFMDWSKEENKHASWVQEYMDQRNACVDIPSTEEVINDFGSYIEVVEFVMETEETTTSMLSHVLEVAESCRDHLTHQFILDPMLKEQIEEEDKARTLLDRIRLANENAAALLAIDANMED